MRRVIVSNLISLDGYIAAADGDLGWFAVGDEFFAYAKDLMSRVDTILFGRVTYQMMEAYWTDPAVMESDPLVARPMNELPKVVFSRTLKRVSWGMRDNASLSADPVTTVTQLRSKPGGDMVIFGSGGLVSALAPHGLIDEYRFIINPSILGHGIAMFRGLDTRIPLKLAASRSFDGKTVMLTYHPEKDS